MTILSRANVPTVEAGSFPVLRPQTAPRPQPSNFLTPSDSTSQIGIQGHGGISYARAALDHAGGESKSTVSTMFHPQQASTAMNVMPPPAYCPASIEFIHCLFPGQSLASENQQALQSRNDQMGACRSNVSLGTGTTLVSRNIVRETDFSATHLDVADPCQRLRADRGDGNRRQIDLQAPCQSAMVGATETSVGLELPPKRELPFARSKLRSPSGDKNSLTASQSEIISTRELVTATNEAMSATLAPGKGNRKGKGKRAPLRAITKDPVARKPRSTIARKKTSTKSAQDEKIVPTVEELLQQPGTHLTRRITRAQSIVERHQRQTVTDRGKAAEIANSEPLKSSHAESRAANPPLAGPTRRITRAASRSLQIPTGETHENKADQGLAFACTPADQIIVPPTPASPTAAAHLLSPRALTANPAEPDGSATNLCLQTSSLDPSPEQVVSTSDAKAINHGTPRLEADHWFANSTMSLQSWTDLPADVRHSALRSQMCRLIMDPNFVNLCKTMESMWERMLLEPRLEQQKQM